MMTYSCSFGIDIFMNHFFLLFYRIMKNMTGTCRYASINTHGGIEQSRRDDLESIAYVFVYFLKGHLPWQGIEAQTKQQKYERIHHKKMSTPVLLLCQGLPPPFAMYLNYVRDLKFEEEPDYSYLRQLFRNLFREFNYSYDHAFDWNILRFGKASLSASQEGDSTPTQNLTMNTM